MALHASTQHEEPADQDQGDLIIAADVLFEERWVEPIVKFLVANLGAGRALICDPDRRTAAGFASSLAAHGLSMRSHAATAHEPDGTLVHGTIYDIVA